MSEQRTGGPDIEGASHLSHLSPPPGQTSRRFLTVFDVAALLGCHEETVRRAYLCGQLQRRRLGVRSCRFDPADVEDWVGRGAPTRMPGERNRPQRRANRRSSPDLAQGGLHGGAQDLQGQGLSK